APDLDLLLLRQVTDDRLVGLEAPQDERPGGPAERRRGLLVAVRLDGRREPFTERLPGPEQSGVGELHDRPQLGEVVLDGRAGERDPPARRDGAYGLGLPGAAVLQRLRLVADDAVPLDRGEGLAVTGRGAVGGEDEVGVAYGLGEVLPAMPPATV